MISSDVMRYQATPVKQTRKADLMVISEMRSTKIIFFLARRHRVGLLAFSNLALISYLSWDKFLHLFF